MCFIPYLAYDMGLHYLTFMGRNLENKKKSALVQIVNSVDMNVVNNVSISRDSATMNNTFIA